MFAIGIMKRSLLLIPLVGVLFLPGRVHGQSASEFQIKAVFIYNFTQFIQWPEKSFDPAQDVFIIGVLGENVFGKSLEEAVAGETYGSRPIVVKYYATPKDIGHCQILYAGSFPDAGKLMSNRPVLTIGEGDRFMKQGGLLRFYKENNKVRIEINQAAASSAGLVVSSKLLHLATIYDKK
jgi:hypothetical protein